MCLLVCAGASAFAPARVEPVSAQKLYSQGRKAEREGRIAEAYLLYSKAAALAPQNPIYWLRSEAVKTRAALQVQLKPPASASAPADAEPAPALDAAAPNEATAKPRPPPGAARVERTQEFQFARQRPGAVRTGRSRLWPGYSLRRRVPGGRFHPFPGGSGRLAGGAEHARIRHVLLHRSSLRSSLPGGQGHRPEAPPGRADHGDCDSRAASHDVAGTD